MNTSAWIPRAKFACGALIAIAMYSAPAHATILVPDVAHIDDVRFNETIVAQCVLGREHSIGINTTLRKADSPKLTLSPLASNSAEEWSAITRDQMTVLTSDLVAFDDDSNSESEFDTAVIASGYARRGRLPKETRMSIPTTADAKIDATQSEELADLRSTATRHGGTMLAVVGFGR